MSGFDFFMTIVLIISGTIFSAVLAAILSISSALVLQLVTRLIAGFKMTYFSAYKLSFLSWFLVSVFHIVGGELLEKYETIEIPSAVSHLSLHESIYPPGAIPYSTYISAIAALIVISIIYGIKIERPDIKPIGICRGFLIAFLNAGLFILFVMSIMWYLAFIGP